MISFGLLYSLVVVVVILCLFTPSSWAHQQEERLFKSTLSTSRKALWRQQRLQQDDAMMRRRRRRLVDEPRCRDSLFFICPPTISPTFAPQPTDPPSPSPTPFPTPNPTPLPTNSPTRFFFLATLFPTANPTPFPTPFPTLNPTPFPTLNPTPFPTPLPTTPVPTPFPTSSPTPIPTPLPTSSPTGIPTPFPTPFPTFPPTPMPSATPTAFPSVFASRGPSRSPSSSPSASPSASPTELPSKTPSISPSFAPSTPQPSAMPSATPSSMPSTMPSSNPTGFPSFTPTTTPSQAPTVVRSRVPTSTPSHRPSMLPSWQPSDLPSSSPTQSAQPSAVPSQAPTFALFVTVPVLDPTSDQNGTTTGDERVIGLLSFCSQTMETEMTQEANITNMTESNQTTITDEPSSNDPNDSNETEVAIVFLEAMDQPETNSTATPAPVVEPIVSEFSIQYTMSTTPGSNEEAILQQVEEAVHKIMAFEFLRCGMGVVVRMRRRQLQQMPEYDFTSISSVPQDLLSNQACAIEESVQGSACRVVDGGFIAEYTTTSQPEQLIDMFGNFFVNTMNNGNIQDDVENLNGLTFRGFLGVDIGGGELPEVSTSSNTVAGAERGPISRRRNSGLLVGTVAIIASAIAVLVLGFFILRRRRDRQQNPSYLKHEDGASTYSGEIPESPSPPTRNIKHDRMKKNDHVLVLNEAPEEDSIFQHLEHDEDHSSVNDIANINIKNNNDDHNEMVKNKDQIRPVDHQLANGQEVWNHDPEKCRSSTCEICHERKLRQPTFVPVDLLSADIQRDLGPSRSSSQNSPPSSRRDQRHYAPDTIDL